MSSNAGGRSQFDASKQSGSLDGRSNQKVKVAICCPKSRRSLCRAFCEQAKYTRAVRGNKPTVGGTDGVTTSTSVAERKVTFLVLSRTSSWPKLKMTPWRTTP